MTEDSPIYLDHNATTPPLPEVVDAMLPFLRTEFGNPSSGHAFGRRARQALDEARAHVAALIGCKPEEIIFTSGGTEANNLAIRGVASQAEETRRHCITSAIEHPATLNPCAHLEERGWQVDRVEVDRDALLRLELLAARIGERTSLVTVMHSNNETGTIQPIRMIAELAHGAGAVMHTDAAQSVGKVPVSVDALGVDLLSIAGHKLSAPKGVGALYVREGTRLSPLLLGASHERGLRPGTENVAGIVGLGVACALAAQSLDARVERWNALRERLWSSLKEKVPDLRANCEGVERLPNTASFRFPLVHGTDVLAATPTVAASTGSACHADHETASSVLLAMGLSVAEALETVRLSIGVTTTEEEIDAAVEALARGWQRVSGNL